jgi:hypothetical protein
MKLTRGRRCGNMNPLLNKDILTIPPGGTTRSYLWWPFTQRGFPEPGKYNLELVYDLSAPDITAWQVAGDVSGGKPDKQIYSRLQDVVSLCITSKVTCVHVKALSEADAAQVLIGHFKRNFPQATFIADDYTNAKWKVNDVRHYRGHISVMVLFNDGYTPPALSSYASSNAQFKPGRYLLVQRYTSPKVKRTTVLDTVAQHFDILVPNKANRFARGLTEKDAEKLGFAKKKTPN